MLLPLFCTSIDEGVAIPSNTIYVDITKEHQNFLYTSRAKPETILNPSKKKTKQFVVIGHVHPEHDPVQVMESLDLVSQYVYKIGTFCELEKYEVDDSNNTGFLTLKCLYRVQIRSLHKSQDHKSINVELENFSISPLNPEKLKELLDYIEENSLIPLDLQQEIKKRWDTIDILDLLAGYIYARNPEIALTYLQIEQGDLALGLLYRSFKESTGPRQREHHKEQKTLRNPPNRLFTIEELKQKINEIPLAEQSKNHVHRELAKLSMLKPDSSEYMTLLDYLNLIASLPWGFNTNIDIDIKEAMAQLNSTHYGLQNVKDEILEYLAIQQHLKKSVNSILCFSGAPGTGKTTIANQIAISSNRPIIRIACGGMGDDNELKGFRRTYIGSRPGRIITGFKDTQSSSPLILLDEIDKLSTHKQDATFSLLEILDPNQNKFFIDKYLEIPYDLSNAMFICTANDTNLIPAPLKDRLDIIEFQEYSGEERRVILHDYMFKKAITEYNLEFLNLVLPEHISDDLLKIPGLRQMEKQLKRLLRNIYLNYIEHNNPEWNKNILKVNPEEKPYVPVGF